MVGDDRLLSLDARGIADVEAGHHAEQLGDQADARRPDRFLVDDGYGLWRVGHVLAQARCREHGGKFCQELTLGEFLSGWPRRCPSNAQSSVQTMRAGVACFIGGLHLVVIAYPARLARRLP